MDRLQAMQIFARVVEMHGFSKAAENLALPPSTVTRAIKELENHLGVKLLQRTTRHLNLTPDGSLYYEHCRRLLAELETVEAGFRGNDERLSGKLRVGMTASMAKLLVLPAIKSFQARHPNVELTLVLSDRAVELVPEGIDCVIRAGVPHDSPTLVARRVASFEWVICASPEYLAEHGEPHSLEDLQRHQAVGFLSGDQGRSMEWRFVVDDEEQGVRMTENLIVNDTETYIACGLEGLGLIRAANYMVLRHLRSGQLRRVLGHTQAPTVPISIMYPHNRHLSPIVRAFVDWAGEPMQGTERQWQVGNIQ
ncbi:LysR family transcriptional regulator [Aquisalimonas asiatica]|uniref:LysR family transcriptional regulator, regulator for bpeEF and oprC n=1 Tax=Aquisalimonas asiatica TaxID=406100 RepID=A0A1H8SYL6_9GAMM|nr:LysR family transcriptional regulator [Aquisalimonas asiatica]SEO83860.1 LysR family transcriptional regulator, regulator for bpeEF and oprC [Aquisalimonas asiatica]